MMILSAVNIADIHLISDLGLYYIIYSNLNLIITSFVYLIKDLFRVIHIQQFMVQC